jgi:uncharacterized protein
MKILVARIPEEGSHYEGEEPGSILQVQEDQFIREPSEVQYQLYAQHVSEELVVRGKLSTQLDLRCTRCSEFFSTTVAVSDFLRAYPAPEGVDAVDVTEDLREELLLQIPGFPVCSEECKGLCVQCGADLNKGSCGCAKGDSGGAWSALDGLNL